MGSLGEDTAISKVTYNNVYTWSSNNMMMIKSNGGSGTVSDIVFENFIGHGNAYSLDIDQYWSSMDPVSGDGVQLKDIKISVSEGQRTYPGAQANMPLQNWTGTETDGAERGPIRIRCADKVPCTGIDITDFNMWTEEGDYQYYSCESAYGSGYCLQDGSGDSAYTTTTTVSAAPTGYSAASMAEDLSTDFGTTVSIPIPTLPASFFPGKAPISAFASASSADKVALSSVSTTAAASSSEKTSAAVVASSTVVASNSAVSSATTLQTAVASASHAAPVSISSETSSAYDQVNLDTSSSASTVLPTASISSPSSAAASYGSFPSGPASSGSEGNGLQEDDGDCEVVYVEA